MTLKHETKNFSDADKSIDYLKDIKNDYLCLFSKDHFHPNEPLLMTDNSLSSRNLYSNSDYILTIDKYADAT